MSCIVTPILIAIRYDFKNTSFDLRVILAPISIAWIHLPVLFIFMNQAVETKYQEIQSLRKLDHYKEIEGTPLIHIKGRNSIHCS
jgi:hypothetical protein